MCTFRIFPEFLGREYTSCRDRVVTDDTVVWVVWEAWVCQISGQVMGQLTFQVESLIFLLLCLAQLVAGVDKVGEEEVKLPDGDIDVVGVDTETWMQAVRRLLQPFAVC